MLSKKNKGYALIWTLLFSLFMMFAILFLFSGSVIDKRLTDKAFAKNVAKTNALFSLNLAMANLQKAAGKDNVATTRLENVSNIVSNLSKYAQPYDIAVFDVTNNLDGIHFDKVFNTILSTNANTEGDFESVNLFADYDIERKAHLIKIDNESGDCFGRYAYFIDDENQKANVTLKNNYENDLSTLSNFIQKMCYQVCNFTFTEDLNFTKDSQQYFSKLDQIDQLKILNPSANLGSAFEAFTVNSYGLLTDSVNKCLKQDLTEQIINDKKDASPHEIFNVPESTVKFEPKFSLIKSFAKYQAGTIIGPDSIFRPQFDKTSSNYAEKYLQRPNVHGFHPVIAGFSLKCNLVNISNELCFKLSPTIVLWNPYNNDFQSENFTVTFNCRNDHETLNFLLANGSSLKEIKIFDNNDCLKFNFDVSIQKGKIYSVHCDDLIIPTGSVVSEMMTDTILDFVDSKKWDFFNIRLYCKNSLLQDVFCYDLTLGHSLKKIALTPNMFADNKSVCCFNFVSRLNGFKKSHCVNKRSLPLFQNCNFRAHCLNFSYHQGPFFGSPFLGESSIPSDYRGNWNYISEFKQSDKFTLLEDLKDFGEIIIFDIPYDWCVPNIGFLRNVNFTPFGYNNTFCLCDSKANPFLSVEKIFDQQTDKKTLFKYLREFNFECDYSYFLNKELFDSWFISTKNNDNELINKRFLIINDDMKIHSENLLIKGAFNVNSTNKDSWISLFKASNERDCVEFYRCFNERTKIQITKRKFKNFIQNLVNNIKECNIFATVSEFINRKVTLDRSDSKFSRSGVVEFSIAESKINSEHEYVLSNKNIEWFDDKSATCILPKDNNLPLSQGDVIAPISHFLTTRGDTFVIRAYGDNYDVNSKIFTSSAICEAVVQRVYEFFDDSNSSDCLFENLSEINKNFGRRFKITSFRWTK